MSASQVVDWDVHGLVRVRAEGAPGGVLRHITEELRAPVPAPAGEPDLRITFVDRLPEAGRLRLLGLGAAAYDDEHFYLVGAGGARARIDLAAAGTATELVCERGLRHVPLLVPLLGLHLAQRDAVLLHAASFVHRGVGVLVAGWQKGGKSETLLPFMAHGAEFVADEWTIVGGSPATMAGIASTALWEWHLRQYPQYWSKLDAGQQRRIAAWRAAHRAYRAAPGTERLPGPVRRRLQRLMTEGGNPVQAAGQLDPAVVFDGRVRTDRVPLQRVVLPVATLDRGVELVPDSGAAIAQRMVHSLDYERSALTTAYQQFRFAFPGRTNPLLERLPVDEQRILTAALQGVPAFELRHPYPVRLDALYEAAAPALEG
ncbi:hypothetical protein QDR37_03625 [Amnibacterium sp. CER49]|uniref:hypothetical protein n=1 Tax=Amnibacterium sp. CER49 TaxID=3039161 RepID=UPI00244C14B0|nr:hypothetical protein [Amnibacterium sp. CER49]MDH2443030.1 hypothetical protein [Amnibacterium sp. CER49]